MLAGAYSSQYKAMERQNVETLKNITEHNKLDALARAKKMSAETNKRRRALAVKRKIEAQREEKRRQQILSKRREKQRDATERYQRSHISSRPNSGSSGRASPRHGGTVLEDALRVVRGSPLGQRTTSPGRTSPTRGHYSEQSDNLNRPHYNKYSSARPSSPAERAQSYARELAKRDDLHTKSLRNLTNSRTLFEQQLENQQQLLLDQQQKSLRDFNLAIMREIEGDRKVQGLEAEDENVIHRSESLSSVDSLEEGSDDTLQRSVELGSFLNNVVDAADGKVGKNKGKVKAVSFADPQASGSVHVVGNVNSLSNTAPVMSAPVQNGRSENADLAGFPATLPASQTMQPVSVPPSTSQNQQMNSLMRQKHIEHMQLQYAKQQQKQEQIQQYLQQQHQLQQQELQQQQLKQQQQKQQQQSQPSFVRETSSDSRIVAASELEAKPKEFASRTDQEEKENQRPKVQARAWATPSPAMPQNTPQSKPQTLVTKASPYSNRNTLTNVTTVTTFDKSITHPSVQQYVDSFASEPPQVSSVQEVIQNNFTAQYGLVQRHNSREQNAGVAGQGTVPVNSTASQNGQIPPSTTQGSNMTFLETVTNDLTAKTAGPAINSTVSTPAVGIKPVGGYSPYTNTYSRVYAQRKAMTDANKPADATNVNGGVSKGKVDTVGGQYSVVPNENRTQENGFEQTQFVQMEADDDTSTCTLDTVSTIVEEKEPVKELKGILKRTGKNQKGGTLKKSSSTGSMKQFGVRDSLEIAKMHLLQGQEEKEEKPVKKNVRFSDVRYEEPLERAYTEGDIQDRLFVRVKRGPDVVSTKPPRPVSASNKSPVGPQVQGLENGISGKPPRAASAGTRTSSIPRSKTVIVRPQAAAHIITHTSQTQTGSNGSQKGYTNGALTSEKKVTIVNNDFMEKIPAMVKNMNANGQMVPTAAPVTVYAVPSSQVVRDTDTRTNYAVSSIVMPKADSAPVGLSNGYPGKPSNMAPTASQMGPVTTIVSSGKNDGFFYDENGLRIDRTPTDDEINYLWEKVRTCLSRTSQNSTVSEKQGANSGLHTEHARQAAPMSNKYIDGNALGHFSSLTRVAPPGPMSHQQQTGNPPYRRTNSADNNSGYYTKRYGLLQRKQQVNPNSLKARQQQQYTVYQAPVQSHQEPQPTGGATPYQPAEEVSESMAAFMTAEQLAEQSLSESNIQMAMEEAQNNQQAFNSTRPKAKSALSMEEQRLLESLDRLNEKLKITESKQPVAIQQPVGQQQHVVHVGGFKGHQPLSSRRRVDSVESQRGHFRTHSAPAGGRGQHLKWPP